MKKINLLIFITLLITGCGESSSSQKNEDSRKTIHFNLNSCSVNGMSFYDASKPRGNKQQLDKQRGNIVKLMNSSLGTNYSDVYKLSEGHYAFFNGYGIAMSNFNRGFSTDKINFTPTINKNTTSEDLIRYFGKPIKKREDYHEISDGSFNSIMYLFKLCDSTSTIKFLFDKKNNKIDDIYIENSGRQFNTAVSTLNASTKSYSSGDQVCSTFGNDSWCGVVLKSFTEAVEVEVTKVNCSGMLCTGLKKSECTGHKFLRSGYNSEQIVVKKGCLD